MRSAAPCICCTGLLRTALGRVFGLEVLVVNELCLCIWAEAPALVGKAPFLSLLPQEFDSSGSGDDNPFMAVWGQAVLILYIAVVNILIMSLVVAVITHAYNPESVQGSCHCDAGRVNIPL